MRSKLFLVTNCIISLVTLATFILCILGTLGSGSPFDWWIVLTFAMVTTIAWVSFGIQKASGAIVCIFLALYSSLLLTLFGACLFAIEQFTENSLTIIATVINYFHN